VLTGHVDGVWSVAFSPDGRLLATAGLDRKNIVWDVKTQKKVKILESRFDRSSLLFSPDGRRLVVSQSPRWGGSGRAIIGIIDVESGREILALEGHSGLIFGVCSSPDGRQISSCGTDDTARIWETFPWREEDYPGRPGMSLAERARLFADGYWRERMSVESAAPNQANRTDPASAYRLDRSIWPRRDEQATAQMIDLSDHYNGLLSVCWQPVLGIGDFGWDLGAMPVGTVMLSNVNFDVRGVISLRRVAQNHIEAMALKMMPTEVTGIKIGQKFHMLHVLHGTSFHEAEGTQLGSLIAHYADGSTGEMQIIYGRDLRDWYSLADTKQETDRAVVAWTGTNRGTESEGGQMRVYKRTWENPFPNVDVKTIDFVSKHTRCNLFLVALTVE
jgi:hypothetical protein